ncbi:MAG: aldo/keto reductase [Peptococcaceae bacterium]|jgi:predicted aldo/keto reductase-like oxidoreductase|nr:aldo/keto reductase [Peptococcaceae bacterium]
MEIRQYKAEGERISLLGFGCMRLPQKGEKAEEIDEEKGQAMVDYALGHGVTYFDTAYPYHNGASELFIGKALSRYPRESFQLASKLPTWLLKSAADVDRYLNEQLEKCQTAYFDYYLVHSLAEGTYPKVAAYNVYERLREKQREGKIRRLGFSFHDKPALLEKIVGDYDWDFAQIQLNYLDWELLAAKEQYEILTRAGLPVIIMEPVRGGALATLSAKSAEIFKKANADVSVASWALRYAASLPNVLTVLSGMTTLEQVRDNVRTMSDFRPLTEGERLVIDEALAAYRQSATIPCTACRYCMDCPSGVDIPKVFAIYNRYMIDEFAFGFQGDYRILGEEKQAHNCAGCGVCAGHCPQAIPIPEWMKKVTALAEELRNKTTGARPLKPLGLD